MKKISIVFLLLSTLLLADNCLFKAIDVDYRIGINSTDQIVISRLELKRIYEGKVKRFSNNRRITVFVKPYSSYCQKDLISYILGMNFSAFIESVNRNSNIKVVKTSILDHMSKTPWSIGVVNEDELYIRGDYGISVLKVVD